MDELLGCAIQEGSESLISNALAKCGSGQFVLLSIFLRSLLPACFSSLVLFIAVFVCTCSAQITNITNDQSVPIPGVGHNYITGVNETVDPSNGSLSLRINVPTPPGRGVALPFHLDYNSGGVIQVTKATSGQVSQPVVGMEDIGLAETSGWRYALPVLTYVTDTLSNHEANQNSGPSGTCSATQGYMFADSEGGRHALKLAFFNASLCRTAGVFGVNLAYSGGDGDYAASTPQIAVGANGVPGGAITVTGADGTQFHYPTLDSSQECRGYPTCALPDYVEDRNGNKLTFTPSNSTLAAPNYSFFPLTITDTVGRSEVAISSFDSASGDTISVSGQKTPYSVTWGNHSFSLSVPGTLGPDGCNPTQQAITLTSSGVESVVNTIQLPNGEAYTFGYDPGSGLLNKLMYPTGAYVSYVWGPTQQPSDSLTYDAVITIPHDGLPVTTISPNACTGQYQAYAVLQRTVYDGARVTEVQKFSYATTWNGVNTTKQTTVTTQDMVTTGHPTSTTIYQYSMDQVAPLPLVSAGTLPVDVLTATLIPEEKTISYYDTTGALLETVGKTWTGGTPNRVTSITTTRGGQTSTIAYQYGPGLGGQISEEDESSLGSGSPGPILRKTLNTYASYPLDKPCMTQIEDGSSNILAEVDSYFDGGTTLCGAPGTATLSAVSGLPSGTHDETNYGPSSTTARGNITQLTHKCLQGCTSSTKTYSYDETGQIVSMTDPCGNPSCADMPGATHHTTTYSYADSPSGGNSTGQSNAYLTMVTNPLGQTEKYQYNYASGELLQSTDENNQSTNYTYNSPTSQCASPYANDGLNRISEISNPDGGETAYCYDDAAASPGVQTWQLQNSVWKLNTSIMDGLGHVLHAELTEPGGIDCVDTAYDGLGRVASVSNPYLQPSGCTGPTNGVTSYSYDALGRKTLQLQPDNTTTTTTNSGTTTTTYSSAQHWSYSGNVTTFMDENSNQWQRTTDALGRLTGVLEPSATSASPTLATSYTYDALGNLLSVTQSGLSGTDTPRNRSFTYDSLSRLLCASNPENSKNACPTSPPTSQPWPSGTTLYSYDANGNVISKTDARGITTTYSYDALNRLLSKTYSDGSMSSCYAYDSGATNGIGRLTSEWTQAGTCASSPSATKPFSLRTILAYDPMGRVASEQQCTPGAGCTTSSGPQLGYGYDLAGNPTCLINSAGSTAGNLTQTPCLSTAVTTPPSGLELLTSYDSAGHMNSVTSNWTALPTPLYTLPTGGYGPVGPVNWTLGPNLSVTQSYTNRLWVNGITATGQLP